MSRAQGITVPEGSADGGFGLQLFHVVLVEGTLLSGLHLHLGERKNCRHLMLSYNGSA